MKISSSFCSSRLADFRFERRGVIFPFGHDDSPCVRLIYHICSNFGEHHCPSAWAIEDDAGRERRSGFSSGEGLGINLEICLSLLFYEGSDSGQHRGSGILLMALDEAERLDERAMNTVRDLLDRVECQLVLALPRMLNIPDSLTHILTALPQGVTHVGVYVPQAAEPVAAGNDDDEPAGDIA